MVASLHFREISSASSRYLDVTGRDVARRDGFRQINSLVPHVEGSQGGETSRSN